eukprot:TRINITY_DN8212_c0_g1_i1.p1 TRINITY_DN8212_c0_g1~~TRINITY_DN8212_c0_g1_i1.p1  ORF type:complete len:249 (-),score=37.45 TRINITY_DN8212_c0_g1_i1:1250-1954(-)
MCGFGVLLENVTFKNLVLFGNDCTDELDEMNKGTLSINGKPMDKECMIEKWQEKLKRRGPDGFSSVITEGNLELILMGAILHLRGLDPVLQPTKDEQGNVLVFNGEIFGGLEVPLEDNDTETLLSSLSRCNSHSEIHQTMEKILGPWSFAYWKPATRTLYFGRDKLGRRSLLVSCSNNIFALSSVFVSDPNFSWFELQPKGLKYNFFSQQRPPCTSYPHHPLVSSMAKIPSSTL